MTVALVALARPASASPPAAATIYATEAPPLAVLAHFPREAEVAGVSYSSLLRRVGSVVAAKTALRSVEVQPDRVDECVSARSPQRSLGLIACLTTATLADFETKDAPRLAVFLTASQASTRGQMYGILIDIRSARDHLRRFRVQHPEPSPLELQRLEDALTERVVLGERTAVKTADEVTAYLEKLFAVRFHDALARTGSLARHGAIELSGNAPGVVFLDGERVAEIPAGRVRLLRVPPGRHAVRIERAGAYVFERELTVAEDATVTAPYVLIETAPVRATRRALLATSAVTVTAGAILVAVSVARGLERSENRRDVVARGESAYGPDFDRLGPVPTAPLGYGLIAAGGGGLVGHLVTEDHVAPWLWTLGGVLVGAAAFGVSAALDGALGPNR